MTPDRKHNHYFKDVSKLNTIDVYRVLQLFNVTDPCLQHAVKKLLVAGGRGAGKDIGKDVQEAIDTLVRWQEMGVEVESKSLPVATKVALTPVSREEMLGADRELLKHLCGISGIELYPTDTIEYSRKLLLNKWYPDQHPLPTIPQPTRDGMQS